ncbi:hypothetical protein STEG23_026573 [Scotinomys teguina]
MLRGLPDIACIWCTNKHGSKTQHLRQKWRLKDRYPGPSRLAVGEDFQAKRKIRTKRGRCPVHLRAASHQDPEDNTAKQG